MSRARADRASDHEADIVRGASLIVIGTVAGGAINFLNEILLARTLGAGPYGQFALAAVLARFGFGVSLFGVSAAVLHFIPVYRNRGETARVIGTVFAAVILPLGLALAAAGLQISLAHWAASDVFGKPGAAPYIALLATAVPFMTLSYILAQVIRGFGYSLSYILVANLIPPAMLLAGLALIRWRGLPLVLVTAAVATSYAVAFVAGILSTLRVVGADVWRIQPVFEFRKLYGYSLPILVTTMLYLIMEWTDLLLLGRFVSEEDVGVYRACMQIALLFDMILQPVNAAASHIFPILADEQHRAERDRAFRLVTILVFALSAPLFFLIASHARAILLLLGDHFAKGAIVLGVLAAARLVRNGLGSSAFLLLLSGRQTVETKIVALCAALKLALNLMLAPIFGIFGAAAGTFVVEVVLNGLRVQQAWALMRVRVPWFLLARMTAVVFFATTFMALAERWAGLNDESAILTLMATVAVEALVLLGSLWLFGLGQEDSRLLMKAVQ
jgi:O-antigen/teichoic acid export membrane protein